MEIPNSIVIFLDGDPRWYDATRFRKFDKNSLQEYIRKGALLEWLEKVKSDPMIPMNIDKVIDYIKAL